jgi:hypothetical protein
VAWRCPSLTLRIFRRHEDAAAPGRQPRGAVPVQGYGGGGAS